MSLLDTIKSLICNLMSDKSGSAQEQEKTTEAVVTEVNNETTLAPSPKAEVAKIQLPEDSMLKRHALAALKAEIELNISPRPSDSTLKRHYDAAVQVKLEERLR